MPPEEPEEEHVVDEEGEEEEGEEEEPEKDYIEIKVGEQPFSIDFHPTKKLVGVGLITGQIKLFDFSGDTPFKASSARPHSDACRALRFAPTGAGVFSAGSDRSLQLRDLSTNKPAWRMKDAHDASVNAIVALGEIGVGSGDDSGAVKLWDLRTRKLALQFHGASSASNLRRARVHWLQPRPSDRFLLIAAENTDFIADMLYTEHKGNTLVVGGGDGCLSVFDLRAGRLLARSDPQDDELLSLALLKNGRKLVCGCQASRVLTCFSTWTYCERAAHSRRSLPPLTCAAVGHSGHLFVGRLR